MAESPFRQAIAADASSFELKLDPCVVDQFSDHYDLLVAWNRKLNLTRIIEPDEAARFHFLESAFLSTLIASPVAAGGRLVDVGSGAGFPGLPLACVWKNCEVVLVEPSGKRAVFLKEAIRKLGLRSVAVLNKRFSPDLMNSSDVLVTRALDGLEKELEAIVTSGASIVALYTDPKMLELAQRLSGEREAKIFEIPGSKNRRIGLLSRHGQEA